MEKRRLDFGNVLLSIGSFLLWSVSVSIREYYMSRGSMLTSFVVPSFYQKRNAVFLPGEPRVFLLCNVLESCS